MAPLPSHFTSLYRLFLRTSSASVLHQRKASPTVRKLWRPAFEDAAKVTTELQSTSLSPVRRYDLELWLQTWHRRIDNTLALLYTSSKSRGLAHQLTRNLAHLAHSEQGRINAQRRPEWKPDLPVGSLEYKPFFVDHHRSQVQQEQAEASHTWDALEEVVRMAEGRHELSLGKVLIKR
ncbi:hypothetical protein C8F04DRAFT_957651 [Mycena alexandri]|uniref:Uncharacterized protein n=1 Tax=Mycena alexandri TaxID=1745969 RepID=A0AAD6SU17_9AGAR|nr:hypothetical protein C8F04DRAFT_957651 [Mycena alexandri]